jgi:glycosyltransferase involved in cell wall biosynthesis
MKVLHLIAGELSSGAARGAYWLHQALRDLGVDSRILTNAKDDLGDESVISLADSALRRLKFSALYRLGRIPLWQYRDRLPLIFSTGRGGVDITRHPEYKSADLVHLHWVNGLVSVRGLGKIKKPIVWTLRDMWPFTGGCHYAMDCEQYLAACGNCPQLGSSRTHDLTRLGTRQKLASIPEDIQVVGISRWMSDCASRSTVLRARKVTTISNNVDTQLFYPLPKNLARDRLGLGDDTKIVLIGAHDVVSVYKGFDLFLEAVNGMTNEKIHVVMFGSTNKDVSDLMTIPSTSLGFLSNTDALRLAYSAADVFVAPSRADAFGKTLVEAMSCGTPVVCFDATGPKDIVEHQVSGYLAKPFSPVDLAYGIQWVLGQPSEKYAELCRSARTRAELCFDSQVIAKKYLALYQDILRGPVA